MLIAAEGLIFKFCGRDTDNRFYLPLPDSEVFRRDKSKNVEQMTKNSHPDVKIIWNFFVVSWGMECPSTRAVSLAWHDIRENRSIMIADNIRDSFRNSRTEYFLKRDFFIRRRPKIWATLLSIFFFSGFIRQMLDL